MQINRNLNIAHYGIQSYGPGTITVIMPKSPDEISTDIDEFGNFGGAPLKKETLNQSLVIMPNQLIDNWPPQSFAEINRDHFEALMELKPEIVLFGTGPSLRWPEPDIVSPLLNSGIGIEVMDTGAACRTYNFLVADGRNVAAALLMI